LDITDEDGVVGMNEAKYGATFPETNDSWGTDEVMTFAYYMPETPETVPDTETVVNTGDRLDTGDVVALWTHHVVLSSYADITSPTGVCGTGATIVLGAATLAASSATFAAYFAF
jgi:hypothetical protein